MGSCRMWFGLLAENETTGEDRGKVGDGHSIVLEKRKFYLGHIMSFERGLINY